MIMALRYLTGNAHVPLLFSALVFYGALFLTFTLHLETYLRNGP